MDNKKKQPPDKFQLIGNILMLVGALMVLIPFVIFGVYLLVAIYS